MWEKIKSVLGGRTGVSILAGILVWLLPIISASFGFPLIPGWEIAAKTIAEGIWFAAVYFWQKRHPKEGAIVTGTGTTSLVTAVGLVITGIAQAFGVNISPDIVNNTVTYAGMIVAFFAQRRIRSVLKAGETQPATESDPPGSANRGPSTSSTAPVAPDPKGSKAKVTSQEYFKDFKKYDALGKDGGRE